MAAWSTRVRVEMATFRARNRRVGAPISSRVVQLVDALVARIVCCGGGCAAQFDDDVDEEQPPHELKVAKGDDSEPEGEPQPLVHNDCGEDDDNSVIALAYTPSADGDGIASRVDGTCDAAIDSHGVLTTFTSGVMDPHVKGRIAMNATRAARVVIRFLRRYTKKRLTRLCDAHRAEESTLDHSPGSGGDTRHPVAQDVQNELRRRQPSRLRAPQVIIPSSIGNSQPLDGSANIPVRASHSPSSSSVASSNDSRCSSSASATSWRDAHPNVVAENAALRRRLDATPPRVFDFETDPRFLSEQQMRRRAILRHRDALRAGLR